MARPLCLHIVRGSLHTARQSWATETDSIQPENENIYYQAIYKKVAKKKKIKKLKKLSTSVQKLTLYFIKPIFYLKF